MTSHGMVCVFEGPNGVGKTTITAAVRALLASEGYPVLALSFPGRIDGSLGARVYDLHHEPEKLNVRSIVPDALQLLHVAAHVDNVKTHIRPHVESGGIVLLDRYWWSTLVYGRIGGVNDTALELMVDVERHYWRGIEPTVVFLLSRAGDRVGATQNASLSLETAEYKSLASQRGAEARIVDLSNDGLVKTAAEAAASIIRSMLHGPTAPSASVSADPSHALAHATTGARLADDAQDSTVAALNPTPSVWRRVAQPKPTAVFDTYWRFAVERQAIFNRRLEGKPGPWTTDPILERYKFTNVYRASDRVSQYLIRNVIYSGDQSPREIFFRVLLFKLFNRIGTWQHLSRELGELRACSFEFERYDQTLTRLLDSKESLYSGAYIMPSGGKIWHDNRKHRVHLRLLEHMLSERVPERIQRAKTMKEAFQLLRSLPTIGDFLAYQYVVDLNYSTLTNFEENEFVAAGPGARDGLRKCFSGLGGLTEADAIRLVCDRQDEEFGLRGLCFQTLWGRPMQLIDCQNVFCEVDKYARIHHPEVTGTSGRKRIKQKFLPHLATVDYWYPPKWGLNERMDATRAETSARDPRGAMEGARA